MGLLSLVFGFGLSQFFGPIPYLLQGAFASHKVYKNDKIIRAP